MKQIIDMEELERPLMEIERALNEYNALEQDTILAQVNKRHNNKKRDQVMKDQMQKIPGFSQLRKLGLMKDGDD